MDPQLAIYNVSTLDDTAKRSLTNERLIASLSATLSLMATVLSIIGLYGVMAYSVTCRTHGARRLVVTDYFRTVCDAPQYQSRRAITRLGSGIRTTSQIRKTIPDGLPTGV
jgi:hypothetical protein